jgi:NodT family efflux transporter outer membrane factor (OMF) lipoprotein
MIPCEHAWPRTGSSEDLRTAPTQGGRSWRQTLRTRLGAGALGLALLAGGCTPLAEFVHNGFKVGPNYQRPPAPLAARWLDAANPRVKSVPADLSAWWKQFGDPVLDDLVRTAYAQDVNLRVAGTRVLEARALRAIAVGSLFPQQQTVNAAFKHVQTSENVADPIPHPYFDDWAAGFNASWEADFWGRFRRSIEAANADLEASVDAYDAVMVTLISDVAAAYVGYRIFEQQLVYLRRNVVRQKDALKMALEEFEKGQASELNVAQARGLMEQTESQIQLVEVGLRQANNQLCVLLGLPPTELAARLGKGPIPKAPPELLVGIPADLIRRRPDLRAAERQIAAQNARIGVAEADFYPAFVINGSFGFEAKDLSNLFARHSITSEIGPAIQWNVLNYGRIQNNVRLQDFRTKELVATYQQMVLAAAQEVENGIITYLGALNEARHLSASLKWTRKAVQLALQDFRNGKVSFNPFFTTEQFLVQEQLRLAAVEGNIALGVIAVYRALGGGWELRLAEQQTPDQAAPGPAVPTAMRP